MEILNTLEHCAHENVVEENHLEVFKTKIADFIKIEKFSDVTLIANKDNKRVKAHRFILSVFSENFKETFSKDESKHMDIVLDIDGEILDILIDYCYKGETLIRENTVDNLIVIARYLSMDPLVSSCCDYIVRHLNSSNCIQLMLFAELHGFVSLLGPAQSCACKYFMEVSDSEEFLKLSFTLLQNIIASDELEVSGEEHVFNRVVSWLNHDMPKRRDNVPSLIALIRLQLLSSSFLVTHVQPFCNDFPECHKHIMEAMSWHLKDCPASKCPSPRNRSSIIALIVQQRTIDNTHFTSSQIMCYCPKLRKWTHLSQLPHIRQFFGVALFEDNLIIAGEFTRDLTDTVRMFNLKTKKCTQLRSMQACRKRFAVVVLHEFVYAICGITDSDEKINTVERLDLRKPQKGWEYVVSPMCASWGYCAAALKGRLYVVGGYDSSGILTQTVECYDPETQKWTERASTHYARMDGTVVSGKGYLYVLGGKKHSEKLDAVERYDPDKDEWTKLCTLPVGRYTSNIPAIFYDNNLCYICDNDNGKEDSILQQYNLATNDWRELSTLDKKFHPAAAITVQNFYNST